MHRTSENIKDLMFHGFVQPSYTGQGENHGLCIMMSNHKSGDMN